MIEVQISSRAVCKAGQLFIPRRDALHIMYQCAECDVPNSKFHKLGGYTLMKFSGTCCMYCTAGVTTMARVNLLGLSVHDV